MEKDKDRLQAFKIDKDQLPSHVSGNAAGVAYRMSQDVNNVDIYTVAPWDSLVWGVDAEDDDFVQVGSYFLPKMLHDVIILKTVDDSKKVSDEGERTAFKVVGSKTFDKDQKPCSAPRPNLGLPYLKSPEISDPDAYNRAPYKSVIWGLQQGDYVKVGERFLPMFSQFGESTLFPLGGVGETVSEKATGKGGGGGEVMEALGLAQDKIAEHALELNRMSAAQEGLGEELTRFQDLEKHVMEELERRLQLLEHKLETSTNTDKITSLAEVVPVKSVEVPEANAKLREGLTVAPNDGRLEAAVKAVTEKSAKIEKDLAMLLEDYATKVFVQDIEKRLAADMQKFQTFDTKLEELTNRKIFQDFEALTSDFDEQLAAVLEECASKSHVQDLEKRMTALSGKPDNGGSSTGYQELEQKMASLETRLGQVSTTNNSGGVDLEPRLASLEKSVSQISSAPTSSNEFKDIGILKDISTLKGHVQSEILTLKQEFDPRLQVCESSAKTFEATMAVELNQIKKNLSMQLTSQETDLAERFKRLEKAIEASITTSPATMPPVGVATAPPQVQRAVQEIEERMQNTPVPASPRKAEQPMPELGASATVKVPMLPLSQMPMQDPKQAPMQMSPRTSSPMPVYRTTSGGLQVYQVPMSPRGINAPNAGIRSVPQPYLSAAPGTLPIQRGVTSRSVSPAPMNYRAASQGRAGSPAPVYSSAVPRSQTPPASPRQQAPVTAPAVQYSPRTISPFAS